MDTQGFDHQPHYADLLRIAFEPHADAPDTLARQRLEEEATAVLQTVLSLEVGAPRQREEDHELAADLQRLERKVDLVLELLALRLADGAMQPPARVEVSAQGVRWTIQGEPPAAGTFGMLTVWLHRLLPRALRLPAVVSADVPGWVRVEFLPVGEACLEVLQRHVFLQHRRGLAEARRARKA